MKKQLLAICIFLMALSGIKAQNSDQEIDLISSILKSEIKVFFAQNMKLSTTDTETFWRIYDEFEQALKPLSHQRINLLKEIIKKEGALSDTEVDEKIALLYKTQKSRLALRIKYYKKIKKELGISVAAQFYQIDSYIFTQVAASINESIPMFGPQKK
ncbi:hypothetical protein [Carboxylicivirga taeanensis]|uniref:hypothetical protein n=1 Tax=Carboxylicivirga taeanensis TaxID=1416875 RepID=UPI003F6DF405